MNKAIPKINESEDEIRNLLKNESLVKRQNRLQALYLIVTKQAKSRTSVAKMLGFNRNTISDWFHIYEQGGLQKLLDIYHPPGVPAKIPQDVVQQIKQVLDTEKGFRTYKEIHQMVVNQHHIEVSYAAVHNLVRYKLKAKAKSPRPSHPKKTSLK